MCLVFMEGLGLDDALLEGDTVLGLELTSPVMCLAA